MDNGDRNPEKIGYEWAAWWALQGDEPLERVHQCAVHLQSKVGEIAASLHDRGDHDDAAAISAANLFLIAISELLDPSGTSEFKAELKRRKAGKPINKHERALCGRRAALTVDRLVGEGWKQEAALSQAQSETGLSRAEIMTWLASNRAVLSRKV